LIHLAVDAKEVVIPYESTFLHDSARARSYAEKL
jgi:hypothetical protein